MKRHGILAAAATALIFGSAVASPVQADEVLYDGVGFLQGTQAITDAFNLPSPGTLTVTLSNIAWPQQLASLDVLVSSASGALGPEMGAGTTTFDIAAAGDFSTQLFGTAQGPLNTGVYAMEVQFQPTTAGSPVPLPTSIALFVSGLGLMLWQRRSRRGVAGGREFDASENRETAQLLQLR